MHTNNTRTIIGPAAADEHVSPGDLLKVLTVDHGVLTVKGRARRPLEEVTRLVVAFLGGAAVATGLSLILRAL